MEDGIDSVDPVACGKRNGRHLSRPADRLHGGPDVVTNTLEEHAHAACGRRVFVHVDRALGRGHRDRRAAALPVLGSKTARTAGAAGIATVVCRAASGRRALLVVVAALAPAVRASDTV